MESNNLIGSVAATLYPTPLRRMLATASAAGHATVMLTARAGILSTLHASSVQMRVGFASVGPVAWIATDACPETAWLGVLAWGARMDACQLPATMQDLHAVAHSRQFPWVGRHIGEITEGDVTMAMEYAAATGHTGVEIDVNDESLTVTGAYPVDLTRAKGFDVIETTDAGITVGCEAPAVDVLDAMLLRSRALVPTQDYL